MEETTKQLPACHWVYICSGLLGVAPDACTWLCSFDIINSRASTSPGLCLLYAGGAAHQQDCMHARKYGTVHID